MKSEGSATLGDVMTVIRGVSYKKEDATAVAGAGSVPILRATNIQEALNFQNLVYVPKRYVSDEQMLRVGDIVIAASSGSRSVVGKAAPLLSDWQGSFGAFCFGLRPKPGVNPKYIAWFMQTPYYRNRVSELAAGVNINNLRAAHIEDTPICIPPLEEQQRIVDLVEEAIPRLGAGVAALRLAQAKLKRYRASVLKAACEGRLVPTEAELARQEGRDYETGEQLLACILEERRRTWNGKGTYEIPDTPSETPYEAPEGWVWSTISALAEVKGGLTKDQKRAYKVTSREVPYMRVANVQRGHLDLGEVKTILASEQEISDLRLQPGDILLNEGGDRDKLGRGWVWEGQIEDCIHQNHVFRARLFLKELNPQFVSHHANTFGQAFFFREGIQTTNLASLSMSKVRSLPVPVPPSVEQRRIIAEVDRLLSVVDQIEASITANLQRATRLRQAVLQQAFSGTTG